MTDPSREASLQTATFDEWPSHLHVLFDGLELDRKAGFTASLVVADEHGRSRTALLSAGELYAPDRRTVAFSLWPASRAARRLRETGTPHAPAALTFVHDATFYQVQLDVEPLGASEELALFVGSIDSGQAQRVGYAQLTSGIVFELVDETKPAVLERWRRQIDLLRRAVSPGAVDR